MYGSETVSLSDRQKAELEVEETKTKMLAVTGMDRSRGDFRYCDLTIVYF